MDYFIEIKKGRYWKELELSGSEKVKYNALINEMGDPATRSISHSNTYSIPRSSKNVEALGMNVFNSSHLAAALNTKYDCRIRANGQIIVEGYLVINKPGKTTISINIIDKALSLLDKWGEATLSVMLNDSTLRANLPTAFKTAAEAMINYVISDSVLTKLPNITGRPHPLALFPNTLNCIGEKFNCLPDGERIPVDRINPFQSRPLFNTRAFLDVICYSYGYEPIYGTYVDQGRLMTQYLVPSGGAESIGFDKLTGQTFSFAGPTYWDNFKSPLDENNEEDVEGQQSFIIALSAGNPTLREGSYLKATEIPGWVDPSGLIWEGNPAYVRADWRDRYNIYVPLPLRSDYDDWKGKITFSASIEVVTSDWSTDSLYSKHLIKAIYRDTSTGVISFTDVVIDGDDDYTTTWVSLTTRSVADIKIDKDQFRIPPAGKSLIGILHLMQFRRPYNYSTSYDNPHGNNLVVSEEYLGSNQLVYNDSIEYFAGVPNLTRSAPVETIKELLSCVLNQQGLLCWINEAAKKVNFFQYDDLKSKIASGNVEDWSKYFIRTDVPEYDTSFGDKYARINRLSLDEPYLGNTYDLHLSDQSTKSKYDTLIETPVDGLKDVSAIQAINLTGTHPYFEFTNEGLGLVYSNSTINGLTQMRADGTIYGSINVPHVQNVNYRSLPTGIVSWYGIINKGVRVAAKFLLPQFVVKTIDLSKPVFISDLRGSFIIEKIGEYQDPQTPVEVTLINPGFMNDTIHFDFEYAILEDQLWLRYSSLTGKYYLHGLSLNSGPELEPFMIRNYSDSEIPFVTMILRTPIYEDYFELRLDPEGSIWHGPTCTPTEYNMVEFSPVND